ncbi:hypothetical protein BLNAU_19953 [Blattamonas nauphoetae]|uniref:Uncharacterized protein n=1 Tax=Blattamonas nauphoetae TaxID=2049346 RepID=A0ABQ9X012_9EUKA|nr:hypothetical protein BLNAU_19953 [Blattamonas nauphoetae]
MKTHVHSAQQHSIRPFRQKGTPLFLRTDPRTIKTLEEASQNFLSLVNFIRVGNHLDDKGTEQACALLRWLTPGVFSEFSAHDICFHLVPKPDGSFSGFTQSIVPLLTSSNEALVNSSLWILNLVVGRGRYSTRFDFVASGFFGDLPRQFYEQKLHLVGQHGLLLMQIVRFIIHYLSQQSKHLNQRRRQLWMDTRHQIFVDRFFRPIVPFLEFICANRRQITDSKESDTFSELFAAIVKFSPLLDQMTQFLLSSSFAVAYTDSIHFFQTNDLVIDLLQGVAEGIRKLHEDNSAVQKRAKQILVKESDDGLFDELELHVRSRGPKFSEGKRVFLGALLIQMLGGNTPF